MRHEKEAEYPKPRAFSKGVRSEAGNDSKWRCYDEADSLYQSIQKYPDATTRMQHAQISPTKTFGSPESRLKQAGKESFISDEENPRLHYYSFPEGSRKHLRKGSV